MSRLLLLRHSKAAKAGPGMHDFDRPLKDRGSKDAIAVGEAMVANRLLPDLVLCSSARRTRQTWDGVARSVRDIGRGVVFLDSLYNSDAAGYLEIIRSAGPAESVLVIGHNPMIAETAAILPGNGDAQAIASLRSRFPTSALAVIGFGSPLSELAPGAGTLETFLARAR